MSLTISEKRNIKSLHSLTFEERSQQLDKISKTEEAAAKRDKFSPFSRWTQFNLEQTQKLMWLQLKHPKAAAILTFLVDHMDEYNAVICSHQVLQEVLEIGRTTTSTAIKILRENGFIAVFKSGTNNVYAVNDDVYWKSWGNNKRYSKFPANVILAESEQEKEKKQIEALKHKEITIKEQKKEDES